MEKVNDRSVRWKKEIKVVFGVISFISLSVVVFGYLFKFASFVFSVNSFLGSGVYVFSSLSIFGVFGLLLSITGMLDPVEK